MGTEMTIDELARRAGVTSRNVRAYQERGLLPAPVVRGRVGYYGDAHFARLQHIAQLTQRGFSLAAVRELFAAWENGWGLAEVLGFEEALAAPWQDEPDVILDADSLVGTFGGGADTIARAVELGLLTDEGDGQYRVASSQLFAAGAALIEVGMPLAAVLEEGAQLQVDMARVAQRFVALFMDHVWRPYMERGMPPEELPAVTRALERLRPVAGMAVQSWLAATMDRHVAEVTAETLVPFGLVDQRPTGSE